MKLLESFHKYAVSNIIRDGSLDALETTRDEYAQNLERGTNEDGEFYAQGEISYFKGAIAAIDEELARKHLVVGDIVEVKGICGIAVDVSNCTVCVDFGSTKATVLLNDLRKVEAGR